MRTQVPENLERGRAQILLAADAGRSDEEIARTVAVGGSTVYRTKRRFVEGNLEPARKKPCWWQRLARAEWDTPDPAEVGVTFADGIEVELIIGTFLHRLHGCFGLSPRLEGPVVDDGGGNNGRLLVDDGALFGRCVTNDVVFGA
jgi:Homeodomain-like domain